MAKHDYCWGEFVFARCDLKWCVNDVPPPPRAKRQNVDRCYRLAEPYHIVPGANALAPKRLAKRASEIVVQFRRTPHLVFRRNPEIVADPNLLVLRIQPDEGMSLSFGAKLPGPELRIKPVEMDFDYGRAFGGEPPEAYERLLLDAMKGDATLYARGDWVDCAWELLGPILDAWQTGDPVKFPNYEAGTWGPSEADTLIEQTGRRWRRP